jgi:translation initiation factor 4G
VQALQTSENAWVTAGRKLGEDDKRSPTYISRKVKSLLNKLTAEKFDSISDQVLEYVNYSVDEDHPVSMKLVIQLIFEKATDEALWGAMYAKLCKKMMNEVDQAVTETIDGKATSGGMLFRKYLVGRCQLDFEAGWKEREAAVAKAAEKGEDDQARLTEQAEGKSSEPAVLSDEYYALQKIKRRGLGLIQLIGELFKLEMVNKNVMKGCFVKLLGHLHETDEEDVESACKLLKTIGPIYDQQSGDNVSGIIVRLEQIAADEKTANRIKFMIQVSRPTCVPGRTSTFTD